MKLYTSYFYQVRFFKPYQIPISTAVFDPKWFHEFKNQEHKFVDKNGVINGLRAESLKPGKSCEGLCHGKPCEYLPCLCDFLTAYEKQLIRLDNSKILARLSTTTEKVRKLLHFIEEPEIILLVHEAPTNECSERKIIQKVFNCSEFNPPSV